MAKFLKIAKNPIVVDQNQKKNSKPKVVHMLFLGQKKNFSKKKKFFGNFFSDFFQKNFQKMGKISNPSSEYFPIANV